MGSPTCQQAPASAFAKKLKSVIASLNLAHAQSRSSRYTYRPLGPPYPQNHMRNIARKASPTDYVLLLDIDVVPNPGASDLLTAFFQKAEAFRVDEGSEGNGGNEQQRTTRKIFPDDFRAERSVYVLPTYELSETLQAIPRTKADLVQLARTGMAQPYHVKVFQPNQHATNFTLWEQDVSEDLVHISHEVTDPEFFYEPFYVSLDSVPPHDERYIGYGFTRNTQVLETKLAGYKFYVLSPLFTCHWGMYKDRRSAKRPVWRERQNSHNNKLFQLAKRELSAKYDRVII